MKKMVGMLLGLMLVYCSCLRDEIRPCPPLQVSIGVKDKNYFNVDDVEREGLASRLDEDLPFRSYVSTLYCALYELESGEKVEVKPHMEVDNEEKIQRITFSDRLPFGRYRMVVWGNLRDERPLEGDATDACLEEHDASLQDIYVAADTLEYGYAAYRHTVELERTKGKLIVLAENMPFPVAASVKEVSQVYSFVQSDLQYDEAITHRTHTPWEDPYRMLTETLMGPSVEEDRSVLEVDFLPEEPGGGRASPENIHITINRNELAVVKYVFTGKGFEIYVLVNDRWEAQHNMDID